MALHAAETQAVRAALEAVCRKLGPIEIDGEAVDQWIHLQVEKTKEDFFVSLENSDPEMAAMLQAWADQGEGKS